MNDENDIQPMFIQSINISDIGKYDRFIETHNPSIDVNDVHLYKFHSNELTQKKLTQDDRDNALDRMFFTLQTWIEREVEEKLQYKIADINRKAKEKIEKLKEKPREKLRKKLHYYQLLESYARQDS